jgi:hypothetical protein
MPAIPLGPGPAPQPPKTRTCKGCGWEFEQGPGTSTSYCEVCHPLNQDVARWVQTHPPTRRSVARPAWLEIGRGVLWILLAVGLFTAFVGLVSFLDWLVFDWLRLL